CGLTATARLARASVLGRRIGRRALPLAFQLRARPVLVRQRALAGGPRVVALALPRRGGVVVDLRSALMGRLLALVRRLRALLRRWLVVLRRRRVPGLRDLVPVVISVHTGMTLGEAHRPHRTMRLASPMVPCMPRWTTTAAHGGRRTRRR